MSEQPPQPIDNPSQEVAARPEATIRIRYNTFEEAQQAEKKFSDSFIDCALDEHGGGLLPFTVGTEKVGLKGYLDKVEATPADEAIINSPEAIAAVYLNTTEMVARNLKVKVAKGTAPERVQEIAAAKNEYVTNLKDEALEAANKIVAWAETGDPHVAPRPGEAFGYYGFKVGEGDQAIDVFDQGSKSASDFHPNIKVQRQGGGNFIFGYSDTRVAQRMEGQKDELTQRIYLNPDIAATPLVFEKVLDAANKAGIPLELKMLQRSEELGAAHIKKSRNPDDGNALRGDGVVIYTSGESANDVIALALAITQDRPEAFAGRKTSRIPQAIAEGVAIGSEPLRRAGQDAESLTSQRGRILATVAQKVADSGKTGQEAREAFRRGVAYYAEREGVDPKNIAFNVKAA
ncbi:MAG: hypothetical protein JWP13_867 [Candidatus Saccharibacteria bacterium]|nr:hypothetical protein [Candidatus Saccharibacteria bacterium]